MINTGNSRAKIWIVRVGASTTAVPLHTATPCEIDNERVEHRHRLGALFDTGHGDAQAVADMDAAHEFEGLRVIERAGAGQDVAEHGGN